MLLKQILLSHFRNVTERTFEINPQLTIIIGENARGKTNLLEGIYFSVNGQGFRESKEEELVQWGAERALVETIWLETRTENLFQIVLHKRGEKVEKQYYVNKAKKNHYAYALYNRKSVLFAPEHIDIVTGSPEKRRDYFNRLLFTVDLEYKKCVQNYDNALYKRNKILERHTDESTLHSQLAFWNEYLEKQATYITKKRQEYVDYLNNHKEVEEKTFDIEYVKNEFREDLLLNVFQEERRLKRTVIGPQKDDFQITLHTGETKNIHHFGSRSEQRLGVFWLKLNEIRYLETFFKAKPILLLDDIFSELDTHNKKLVLDLVENYQTVLTTTEKELLELAHIEKTTINL